MASGKLKHLLAGFEQMLLPVGQPRNWGCGRIDLEKIERRAKYRGKQGLPALCVWHASTSGEKDGRGPNMELQQLGLPPTRPRKRTRRSSGSGSSSQVFIVAILLVVGALSWLCFSSPFEANRQLASQRVGSTSSTAEKEESEETSNNVDGRGLLPSPFPRPTLGTGHDSSEERREEGVYGGSHSGSRAGPYHDWELFRAGFHEMSRVLKIFVYRDVFLDSAPFANVFLPHPDPFNPKLGNYFSEHMFKISLLRSSFLTSRPEDAHLFFLPFSINAMRNDPRVRSEPSITDFVANYTNRISQEARFWNASAGSDHFYVCCHSVGRFAASKHSQLHNNAMQVSCSSSYFQRLYISHKDVGLPQVWPRPPELHLNPSHARTNLVFFSGRAQNSRVRQELISAWENDTSMSINAGKIPFSYEEGFRSSQYCLHVKGYEVNTARISDAIHYGCVPVIVSDHYDLPFARTLDWKRFSVIIKHEDIDKLKEILVSISQEMYESMYFNLRQVREHFQWHKTPKGYDAFHMTVYELWARRAIHLRPIARLSAFGTQGEKLSS